MEKLYDIEQKEKIKSIMANDLYKAKGMLEKYLGYYKRDLYAFNLYCSLLITIGDFKNALKILDKIEKQAAIIISENEHLNGNVYRTLDYVIYHRLLISYYLKDYNSFFALYHKLLKEEKTLDVEKKLNNALYIAYLYAKRKTRGSNKKYNDKNYIYKQARCYSEEEFLKRMNIHFISNNNEQIINRFFDDFPLNQIIEEVKKFIPSENKLYTDDFFNTYIFRYDCCGICNSAATDYFEIVTFDDSREFITMHPCEFKKNMPYINLNYLQSEDKAKSIQLSQIDKFNKKYNLNNKS